MNAIPPRQSFDGPALQIALVNNMPDQAIDATKAQFRQTAARRHRESSVLLALLHIVQHAARGDGAPRPGAKSRDIEALYARGADALIVTGSEPRADKLESEPYWDDFTRLVDWARVHTNLRALVCLAAHGAVLRLDSVTRRRAGEKSPASSLAKSPPMIGRRVAPPARSWFRIRAIMACRETIWSSVATTYPHGPGTWKSTASGDANPACSVHPGPSRI